MNSNIWYIDCNKYPLEIEYSFKIVWDNKVKYKRESKNGVSLKLHLCIKLKEIWYTDHSSVKFSACSQYMTFDNKLILDEILKFDIKLKEIIRDFKVYK
jgi:hypothetical protein